VLRLSWLVPAFECKLNLCILTYIRKLAQASLISTHDNRAKKLELHELKTYRAKTMCEIVIKTIKSVRRVDKKSRLIVKREISVAMIFATWGEGTQRYGVIVRLGILERMGSGNRRLYLSSENLSFCPEMVHSFDA